MRFCIIRWLPRWRANSKSCCSRIRQTSKPDSIRSLPNRHRDLGYEYLAVKSPGNFGRRCGLKEERKRLDQIGARLFNRCPLAGDVQLRTQRDESVVFAFNDRSHLSKISHALSVTLRWASSTTPMATSSRKSIKSYSVINVGARFVRFLPAHQLGQQILHQTADGFFPTLRRGHGPRPRMRWRRVARYPQASNPRHRHPSMWSSGLPPVRDQTTPTLVRLQPPQRYASQAAEDPALV